MRTIRPKLPEMEFELSGDPEKNDDNYHYSNLGGAVASWLVRSSLDRAVLVRGLAGDIVGKT